MNIKEFMKLLSRLKERTSHAGEFFREARRSIFVQVDGRWFSIAHLDKGLKITEVVAPRGVDDELVEQLDRFVELARAFLGRYEPPEKEVKERKKRRGVGRIASRGRSGKGHSAASIGARVELLLDKKKYAGQIKMVKLSRLLNVTEETLVMMLAISEHLIVEDGWCYYMEEKDG